jgi:hypothetical protein
MNRRAFFLATGLLAKDSPRNELAHVGNAFSAAYTAWTVEINKCKDSVYNMSEAATFEEAAKAWRKLEKERREWLKWSV